MALPEKPITRVEHYLNRIAGQSGQIPDVPFTRVEHYLDYIAKNGGGGGGGTIDPVPTEGSTNAVSSGGVYDSFHDLTAAEVKVEASGDVTETGNPVEIETSFAQNASELSVALEPIQDLHGYDKPWSGGNGKNKLNPDLFFPNTAYGVTLTCDTTTGRCSFSGTNTESSNAMNVFITKPDLSNAILLKANTTYYFCANWEDGHTPSSSTPRIDLREYSGATTIFAYETSKNGGSYTPTEDVYVRICARFPKGFTSTGLGLKPVLTTDNDVSFEPYSNICPISGRSSTEIDRVGKNLKKPITLTKTASGVTFTEADGIVTVTGTATGRVYDLANVPTNDQIVEYSNLFPAGSYKAVMDATGDVENQLMMIRLYDEAFNQVFQQDTTSNELSFSCSVPCYVYFRLGVSGAGNANITYKPVIVSSDVSDTSFEPYDSTSLTLDLGRDVYGGTVDVVNGTLTVNMVMVDLGDLTWQKAQGSESSVVRFGTTIDNPKTIDSSYDKPNIVCSAYETITANQGYLGTKDGITIANSNGRLFVNDSSKNDLSSSDFKTAVSGVQFCYELATPQTYTITPQLLALLKGYNRISGDGVITIGYQGKGESDVQTELDEHSEKLRSLDTLTSSIAPVETSTASANYAVGDYLMLDGSLCKVTSAIATGETITIGSNVTVTTVAAELLAIIAQM